MSHYGSNFVPVKCEQKTEEARLLLAMMYLLIVLQFIVQDNSIGLIRLGPGQRDAVRGSADLVDDGHCWWCWEQNKGEQSKRWKRKY